MPPRIEKLGRRDWRLLWLGRIRRSDLGASLLEVEVVFIEDPLPVGRQPALISDYRPIEELPLYGVQAAWRDGKCVGYRDAEHSVERLLVQPSSIRFAAPGSNALPEEDYALYGRRYAAGCWVFSTWEGVELVVPGWQILQAWYLFDRHVVSSVIAGMLDVDRDYGTKVPWLPGTQCVGGRVSYRLPPEIEVPTAKAFSRLLFDPVARRNAMQIWSKLVVDKLIYPPMIRPPHDEPAEWTFRMRPMATRGGLKRWLLLHLQAARVPLPFHSFEVVKEEVASTDEADRSTVVVRRGNAGLPRDDDLPLSGRRSGGRGRRDARFDGLAFLDHEVEGMPVTTTIEARNLSGSSAVLMVAGPNEPIDAVSMATEGKTDGGTAGARPRGPAKPAEDAQTLFRRSRAAFEAVASYVEAHPDLTPECR